MANQDDDELQNTRALIWAYIGSPEVLSLFAGVAFRMLGKNHDDLLIDDLWETFVENILEHKHVEEWAAKWKGLSSDEINRNLSKILNTSARNLCINYKRSLSINYRRNKSPSIITFTELLSQNRDEGGISSGASKTLGVMWSSSIASPDEQALKNESEREIKDYLIAAIATLTSEIAQRVVFCRLMLKMPFGDIAQKYGMNENTTKTHFKRAKPKLADWWAENREKPLPEDALSGLKPSIVELYKERLGEKAGSRSKMALDDAREEKDQERSHPSHRVHCPKENNGANPHPSYLGRILEEGDRTKPSQAKPSQEDNCSPSQGRTR